MKTTWFHLIALATALTTTAPALTFPASFSLEVGRTVDLTQLTKDRNVRFTSSHPDLVEISGTQAKVLHLTPDGTTLTITAQDGKGTVRAAVTTHGIEYGIGKGTVLRPGQPLNSFRVLVIRARGADGRAPAQLDSAYGFNGNKASAGSLAGVPDAQKIGNMLVAQWNIDAGQVTWDYILRAGNITRRFNLDREVLTPMQQAPNITGSWNGRTLVLRGNAPDTSSLTVRTVGSADLLKLPPFNQPGRTALPAQLTLTLPGGSKGSLEVRLYNAPVLDPRSVLPNTFTWTQHPVATLK